MSTDTPAGNRDDPIGALQILISRIDSESHAQDVVDKALSDLSADEQRRLIDVLSVVCSSSFPLLHEFLSPSKSKGPQ